MLKPKSKIQLAKKYGSGSIKQFSVPLNLFSINDEEFIDKHLMLLQRLTELCTNGPSYFGFKKDIESILNEIDISKEEFMDISISYLSKRVRTSDEKRIIACFLFFMDSFMEILNNLSTKGNQSKLFQELFSLAGDILYEKAPKNHIFIRFGEKGRKAYILFKGCANVLVPQPKTVITTKDGYFCYLANLIRYQEFGLVNLTVNENFNIVPLYIIDDMFLKKEKRRDGHYKRSHRSQQNLKNISYSKSGTNTLDNDSSNNNNIENAESSDNEGKESEKKNLEINKVFKLNDQYAGLINSDSVQKITASELLQKFNLELITKKRNELNNASTELYIKRTDISEHLSKFIGKKAKNNLSILKLKIYTYTKVAELRRGSLFGEMALNEPNAMRKATIISDADIQLGILDKKTYDNCIKAAGEKHTKNTILFLVSTELFKGVAVRMFYNRYYTHITQLKIKKGDYVLEQNSNPEHITLIRNGSFSITTKISLNQLTDEIIRLINILKSNKDVSEQFKEMTKAKTEGMILMRDNIKFEKFYKAEQVIKVSNITGSQIIGTDEFIGNEGRYLYDIVNNSSHSDIYKISFEYFEEICSVFPLVNENYSKYIAKKYEYFINRLITIRNTMIKSFFDYKTSREISPEVMKEIESKIYSGIRSRRLKCLSNSDINVGKIMAFKEESPVNKNMRYRNLSKYNNNSASNVFNHNTSSLNANLNSNYCLSSNNNNMSSTNLNSGQKESICNTNKKDEELNSANNNNNNIVSRNILSYSMNSSKLNSNSKFMNNSANKPTKISPGPSSTNKIAYLLSDSKVKDKIIKKIGDFEIKENLNESKNLESINNNSKINNNDINEVTNSENKSTLVQMPFSLRSNKIKLRCFSKNSRDETNKMNSVFINGYKNVPKKNSAPHTRYNKFPNKIYGNISNVEVQRTNFYFSTSKEKNDSTRLTNLNNPQNKNKISFKFIKHFKSPNKFYTDRKDPTKKFRNHPLLSINALVWENIKTKIKFPLIKTLINPKDQKIMEDKINIENNLKIRKYKDKSTSKEKSEKKKKEIQDLNLKLLKENNKNNEKKDEKIEKLDKNESTIKKDENNTKKEENTLKDLKEKNTSKMISNYDSSDSDYDNMLHCKNSEKESLESSCNNIDLNEDLNKNNYFIKFNSLLANGKNNGTMTDSLQRQINKGNILKYCNYKRKQVKPQLSEVNFLTRDKTSVGPMEYNEYKIQKYTRQRNLYHSQNLNKRIRQFYGCDYSKEKW